MFVGIWGMRRRSRWRESAASGIAGSNPCGGMDVGLMWVLCVAGIGLCVGLITRLEESYRVWCVLSFDREASTIRRP